MPYVGQRHPSPDLDACCSPTLIVVHGTGATAEIDLSIPDRFRWWQEGSDFDQWLCSKLCNPEGESLSSDQIYRFEWSGLNSELEREAAAKALEQLVRSLASRGSRVHLLAHSHGGNVVRRMIELAAVKNGARADFLGSVITFGTPFFHYSLRSALARVVAVLIKEALFLAAYLVLPSLFARTIPLGIDEIWYKIPIGAAGLFVLIPLWDSLRELRLRTRFLVGRLARHARIINLYATRDEAVSLLISLNSPIHLMRRREAVRWVDGPLGWSFVAIIVTLLGFAIISFVGGLLGFGHWAKGLMLFFAALGLFVAGVVLSLVLEASDRFLDLILTSRLRTMAFGNDCGAAIASISLQPWPNSARRAIPLPKSIEEAAEGYIAANTTHLWSTLRAALTPSAALLSQDFTAIVDRVLTGDELVHTVYYRLEPFAELIVRHLVRSGDWAKNKKQTPDKIEE